MATGVYAGYSIYTADGWNDGPIIIPTYKYSPQEIFVNNVPLFDVNFFEQIVDKYAFDDTNSNDTKIVNKSWIGSKEALDLGIDAKMEEITKPENKLLTQVDTPSYSKEYTDSSGNKYKATLNIEQKVVVKAQQPNIMTDLVNASFVFYVTDSNGKNVFDIPKQQLIPSQKTPYEGQLGTNLYERMGVISAGSATPIMSDISDIIGQKIWEKDLANTEFGKVLSQMQSDISSNLFVDSNASVSNEVKDSSTYTYIKGPYKYVYSEGSSEVVISKSPIYDQYVGTLDLKKVVSSWYVVLRRIALVGMMSVLVYIGIRILMSSTAGEKAKYKQLVQDWFIGVVMLFVMHYGMVFANRAVDELTTMIAGIKINTASVDANVKLTYPLYETGIQPGTAFENNLLRAFDYNVREIDENTKIVEGNLYKMKINDADTYIISTNLMGKLRMDATTYRDQSTKYIGATIMFLAMVAYTLIFTWSYLKRVIYMAFLTLIAPLVALTYPIDKANDGKAQGFDFWVKEYIFNLLLQPMHLLLYTILITSAIKLATTNMLYAIVAIGFMVPAENLLRQMFNFQKAKTPGVLGGAAGAAFAMSGMKWLFSRGPKGGEKGSAGGKDKGDKKESYIKEKPRTGKIPGVGGTPTGTEGSETTGSGIGNGIGEKLPVVPNEEQFWNDFEKKQREELKEKNRKIKFLKPLGNGLKGYGGRVWRNTQRSMRKSLEEAHTGRKLAKMGAGVLGATAFGTAAAAMGVAGGDAGKAAQYAAAGVAGGYKLGSNSADSVSNWAGQFTEGAGESFQREFYGDERYEDIQKQKEYREAAQRDIEEAIKKRVAQSEEELARIYSTYESVDFSHVAEMEKMAQDLNGKGVNIDDARYQAQLGYYANKSLGSLLFDEKKKSDAYNKLTKTFNLQNDKEAEAMYNLGQQYVRFVK